MKIRGDEVYWLSDNGNVAIVYSQFDLGENYKIFRKVCYGKDNELWEYVIGFVFYGEALDYARKILDVKAYRN